MCNAINVVSMENARLKRDVRLSRATIEADADGTSWLVIRSGDKIIAQARLR